MTVEEYIDKVRNCVIAGELSPYQVLTRMEILVLQLQNTSSNNKYTASQASPKLRKSCYIEGSFCLYDENKMCEDCYDE